MFVEKEDLKKTINLPRTDFGMKANLAELEPRILARWEKERLYEKLRAARAGAPKYVLHDGPPYASGELHIGTGMNKILKDIVLKYKALRGFDVPYIPGWDCHGLPIERKALDEMQKAKEQWEKPKLRVKSEEFARRHIEGHRRQFKALGILGRWEEPYLTLDPKYEAAVIDLFGQLVEKGYVYRRRKPIHWCSVDQTALAEAELEYRERSDPSVTLRFPAAFRTEAKADRGHGLLVWTTTPWTLFGNVAVAVNADADYDLVRYERAGASEISVVASALRARVLEKIGASGAEVLRTVRGKDLEGLSYTRPFALPRIPHEAGERPGGGRVVTAPYVSLEDGTGLVHTAPGHGREDYETALREGLAVLSPVDAAGRLTDEVPERFRGQWVLKANEAIVEDLRERGILLHAEEIRHSYPHCWRCRGPLIFRATEQWFVSVDHDRLRERTLAAVRENVRWVPDWGEARIESMIRERPDWCISRQRAWGIPIPAFYCERCGEPLVTRTTCDRVRDIFAKEGANAWFLKSAEELLGPGFHCGTCGGTKFRKEDDIFDVWFESGSSWHAVIDQEPDLRYPADLYLEGSDQHRGWFQLSMLPAMAARGEPPFKTVVTHGFMVDEKGQKMSKSLGNYISLEEGLERFSGDILRLYFSSIDYGNDVVCSVALIEKMRDTYRKIRNTFKYMLGNLHDAVPGPVELEPIDRWALARVCAVRREVEQAYEEFRFHRVYRAIHDLCAVELSTIYFEAARDRLYCERPDDPRRRAAQFVLASALDTLVRLLAPILAFTMEEVWEHMRAAPWGREREESVHLARWPSDDLAEIAKSVDLDAWGRLLALREKVYQAIEPLRKEKAVGEPTDALVTIECERALLKPLEPKVEAGLAELFVVAGVELRPGAPGGEPRVEVRRSPHEKCARCWVRRPSVRPREALGATLCERCAGVLERPGGAATASGGIEGPVA
jgi:isoleucyl-tRNA synthetase